LSVPISKTTLFELAARLGGELSCPGGPIERLAPPSTAGEGDLAPLFRADRVAEARAAVERGASLLIAAPLVARAPGGWVHAHASWVMAALLDTCTMQLPPARVGEGVTLGEGVVLHPGVTLGNRVKVGANAVIGHPGFGWATGPDGAVRAVPQLGGVVVEDDVSIGPLSTVDSGTLTPTIVRRGAKLDAQVHVGHNCIIGEGCLIAAQTGLAGSVTLGRSVLCGGQVGIADHVTVGDFAKIAAKSGVIGDVPAHRAVAGYPAVSRMRWLRALAWLNRAAHRTGP
jgi:UDP-3-O-[3-hydroxymyristoyl] glucosamine N-acyltransferase